MKTLKASIAQSKLEHVIDEAATHHIPVKIVSRCNAAILVGEGDWRAIRETLHLLSIPRMRESIRKGMRSPSHELSKNPGFDSRGPNK